MMSSLKVGTSRDHPDPEAEKPDDWDDEEDGEWTAPEIPTLISRVNGSRR